MKHPKISIVTPSYNQGQFLEETILSVLNQDYPNIEYIIIDGGSTDNSVDIIKKYADRLTYWVSEPDKGQSDAINKGFRRATGEIFNWINSDDYFLPGAFHAVVDAFSSGDDQLGFVYGDCRHIKSGGTIIEDRKMNDFDSRILRYGRNLFAQPSSFFHQRVLEEIGMLDENLSYAMDYEFWIRAYEVGFTFRKIDKLLAAFRFHGQSKTVGGRNKLTEEYEQVMLDKVLHMKKSQATVACLKMLVKFYRLKNAIVRGLKQKQWTFNSLARARKKGWFQ